MAHSGIDAFFVEGAAGRLFCLLHEPSTVGAPKGAVVFLAPFAEEMNKSRRMAALQARALAALGWWVLQPDLYGCGDSEGDYRTASWSTWQADASLAFDFLAEKSGLRPALWGMRAGCLLAASVALVKPGPHRLLFWQPVTSGKQHLQQFLRMRIAGAMLSSKRGNGEDTNSMRAQLRAGTSIEVAGYMLAPDLALGLESAALSAPPDGGRLSWFEVSRSTAPEIAIASRQAIGCWKSAGWRVDATVVAGAAFWQTQEIEEVPALIAATSLDMSEAFG